MSRSNASADMKACISRAAELNFVFTVIGVGGIEAEAVMLGQPISMVLPEVVGYRLTGEVGSLVTSTDVVLTITKVSIISFSSLFGFYFIRIYLLIDISFIL